MTFRDRVSIGLGGVDIRDSLLEDLCAFRRGLMSGDASAREGLGFAGGLVDVGASS